MTPTPAGQALSTLKDVPGVLGSFIVSGEGTMVARDLASMFTDDLLDEVGPRLLRIVDAFSGGEATVQSCVLRYREHLLFVRGVRDGVVCVISEPRVSMPALRMGVNLLARRLGTLAAEAVAPIVLTRPRASVAIPLPTPPPDVEARSAAARPGIQYRGAVMPKGKRDA